MASRHSSVREDLDVRISHDQGANLLDGDNIRFLSVDVRNQSSHETIEKFSIDPSSPSTTTLPEDEPMAISSNSTQTSVSRTKRTWESKGPLNAAIRIWLPEALAFVCGLGAFVAIFMILAGFNKSKQPQWSSYINLSTIVALLATLLRSMLMQVIEAVLGQLKWAWYASPRPLHQLNTLDQASRGPWGSIRLLFSMTRVNRINLAAILSVTAVGIGTFAQQSVKTFACGIVAPKQAASVPIAQNTSSGFNMLMNPGSASRLKLFDIGMRSALIAGLAGSPSLSSLPIDCPTGNCTFGNIYHSLAFDSLCTDASHRLTQNNPFTWSQPNDYSSNFSLWANYSISGLSPIAYDLELFPNFQHYGRWHPVLAIEEDYGPGKSLFVSTEEEAVVSSDPFTLFLTIPRRSPCAGDEDGIYQSDYNDVAPVPAVNTTLCQALESGAARSYPGSFALTAAKCLLYPSLRSYRGAITNGQLQESPTASSKHLIRARGHSTWERQLSYFNFADPCIINNTVYSSSNYSDAPGLITLRGGPSDNMSDYTGPSDCLYSLPLHWDEAISDTLGGVLNSPEKGDCYVTSNYSNIMCGDKWWLATLYNNRNASVASIGWFMQNIADSLTLQLRKIGIDRDGNPAMTKGVAMRMEVCTRFEWAWLLYPAVITVFTAVLLAIVALPDASGTHASIPWKTSILPLLVYRLGPELSGGYEAEKADLSEGKLEKKAKSIRVKLDNVHGQWRFQKT